MARMRVERAYTTHHLLDKNTDSRRLHLVHIVTSLDSDEGSSNEATSSLEEYTKPIRADIINGKMPGFRDSMRWKLKGAKKHFQEGLTTRRHIKCSIAEEVRIIDSELPKYPDIET
ncbi:hypothetical protein HAX54_016198, partial [Datura stramonium]|nr:hypothetical protein [Datura stramonium]